MLAPADSPAAPEISSNSSSHSSSSNTSGRRLLQYAAALLRYGSRRASRTGPRLLLYVAAAVTALLVVSGVFSDGGGDDGGGGRLWLTSFLDRLGRTRTPQRKRPPQAEANASDGRAGGGLRVVVFGENDVATSRLQNIAVDARALGDHNSTAWTEELCVELRCTSYQSFVPALDLPRRSLSSNALYGELTESVVAASRGALPASDFSFVGTAYPVPQQDAPDLRAQVAAFLAQPPPARPPRDTVWIVSVGAWDVWSLAAFPQAAAEDVVVSIVSDIFAVLDTLFQAAHDRQSPAYSDRRAVPRDDAGRAVRSKAKSSPHPLPWNHTDTTPFRVLVPLLLDPSVLPGWLLERPAAPPLHTRSEQVRRAVRLTKLWNARVEGEMAAWMRGGGVEAEQPEESNPADHPANGTTKHRRADSSSPPRLARDGTLFPMADYIMDAMIDSQLKAAGLVDRRKFGTLPKAEAFADVRRPCLAVPGTVPGEVGAHSPTTFTVEIGGKATKTKKADHPPRPVLCDKPDQHLFFTAFSLGRRGIEELGRLGAALLRADQSVRAAWTAARAESGGNRGPASWKEYYEA